MKYGSVCSGIEAASVAWESLGWKAQWYSEIEQFPSAVLAHRFPTVPNLGDMTKIHETQIFKDATINLLVGGTPCQSFSVAGLRKGLADPRGNLMLTFLSLAEREKPRWIVWENVPGVLSSNGGRDFATFLTALGQLGYGYAYRVLDAQYFGVAQRRRRVFVVGYLGDWRPPAAVLFEQDCLSGHFKKSREKRQATASDVEGGVGGGSRYWGSDPECSDTVTSKWYKGSGGSEVETGEQGGTPGKKAGKGYLGSDELAFTIGTTQDQQIAHYPIAYENHPSDSRVKEMGETCSTVTSKYGTGGGNTPLVAQPIPFRKARRAQSKDDHETWEQDEKTNTLNAFDTGDIRTTQAVVHYPIAVDCYNQTINEHTTQTIRSSASDVNHYGAVLQPAMAIRRLTPRECERLQGFPDDWTKIPYRNKSAEQCPDGNRYKACGNSMAVPVMRWIGERIEMVEQLMKEIK